MDGNADSKHPVPDVVMRAATAARLGAARPAVPTPWLSRVLSAVAFVLFAAVVLGVLAAQRWWFWFWLTVFAISAAVVGIVLELLSGRRGPRPGVYEFDGGLVVRQAEPIAFAWEDIEYVERARAHPGAQGSGYHTYSYRIRPRGADITTEVELPTDNDWAAARTAAVTIDRARESLARGETVSFGPISVGPDRLAAKDRSLAWSEVDRVVRAGAFVRVFRRGRRRIWATVPIGDVPDARAVVVLARDRGEAASPDLR